MLFRLFPTKTLFLPLPVPLPVPVPVPYYLLSVSILPISLQALPTSFHLHLKVTIIACPNAESLLSLSYYNFNQVFINYGEKGNADLLLLYGFALDRNPFNAGECISLI